MAKVVQVDGITMISAELENLLKMILMRGLIQKVDKDVIQVVESKWQITKKIIHHSLKHLSHIPNAKIITFL